MTEADKLAYKKHDLLLRLANLEDDPNKKYKLRRRAFLYLSPKEQTICKLIGWGPREPGEIEYR